ncbi:putative 40S ribosomal protein S24-2 [Blattamonas nauphoetae]|uniref:40S ribosomal protein S24-2 n=1 Tax=Blattamonas nauphoetae TaxID=2049346 RepID=A0ABQ9YM21_9EUKA|nr:putative 40S ribosomal protein S24-2 [Blattamonas nauphoetae]KAK2964594.1 putative 40S ribosomal protein S24-2 [Blattamonas nauphoetae]
MSVTIQTRKVLINPLLHRKQMTVNVIHPGQRPLSRLELRDKLAQNYKIKDPETIICYGLKTHFGGNLTTGFALIYDKKDDLQKTELRLRKIRHKLSKPIEKKVVRKSRKEKKNKSKKNRGVKDQKEIKAQRRQKNQ